MVNGGSHQSPVAGRQKGKSELRMDTDRTDEDRTKEPPMRAYNVRQPTMSKPFNVEASFYHAKSTPRSATVALREDPGSVVLPPGSRGGYLGLFESGLDDDFASDLVDLFLSASFDVGFRPRVDMLSELSWSASVLLAFPLLLVEAALESDVLSAAFLSATLPKVWSVPEPVAEEELFFSAFMLVDIRLGSSFSQS